MKNALWPIGTWIADKQDGIVYFVSQHRNGYMMLKQYGHGFAMTDTRHGSWFTELPKVPDEDALEKRGVRPSGRAEDCSSFREGRMFITLPGSRQGTTQVARGRFDGWRWLAVRIEEKKESDIEQDAELIRDIDTYDADAFSRGYAAGYQACRDDTSRILSARMENHYDY